MLYNSNDLFNPFAVKGNSNDFANNTDSCEKAHYELFLLKSALFATSTLNFLLNENLSGPIFNIAKVSFDKFDSEAVKVHALHEFESFHRVCVKAS